MGVGFGLVQGLTKGASAIQEGKAEAKRLEQKALHEALARKLLEAQIERVQRPVAQSSPGQPIIIKGKGGKQYAVTRGPDGSMHVEDLPEGEPESPKVPLITGPGGTRIPDVAGAQVQPDAPKEPPRQTGQEQAAQAFGATQTELRPEIEALENKGVTPSTGAELVEGLGNLPFVGGMVRPVTQKGANYLRDEDQQKLRNLAGQWMIATLRLDSQGTVTPAEFDKYYNEYFRQPGDEPGLVKQKQAARRKKEAEASIRGGGGARPAPGAALASPSGRPSYVDWKTSRGL